MHKNCPREPAFHEVPHLKTHEGPLEDTVLEDSETEYCGEETRDLRSILGRSPFTPFFHRLLEEVKEQAAKEPGSNEEKLHFCPGIIDFLFQNDLAIFPLLSGLLLGNVKRYASDEKNLEAKSKPEKTQDTNCHVEKWFGIVKHSIIKEKCVRPGTFVRKMLLSLQGRYTEHILQHNLSQELLLRPSSRGH
ncbi:Leucine--tRNA ligase [Labeo rohita]|uniref:Leucine--tRNA ligase n=1 Tax=Labeo rohita TaxID=84645 RepID=A0ABQ8L825_LABRO|nr:Leucine--tRNA ligase [Labeo rohita]